MVQIEQNLTTSKEDRDEKFDEYLNKWDEVFYDEGE